MRILHTADWHLGKIVNEYSMLSLQKEYLSQLINKLSEYEIDVLIIAGDLYDRAIPPKEAVELVNQVFTTITQKLKIPIIIIGGNHDSQERIEYGSELLAMSGLYIEGTTKEKIRKVSIENVDFYMVPYDDYRKVREILKNEKINSPEDALREQLKTVQDVWNPNAINILIYHGFIININAENDLEESESERPLNIGNVEFVPVELVEDFDYVALGHLHKAQKVRHDYVRYSGAPLKYSKSEANYKKQDLLLDFKNTELKITPLEINLSKDLRVIRGRFDEIIQNASEDYVFFELEDETYVIDAMNKLRQHYPYTMGLEYINRQKNEEHIIHHSKDKIRKQNLEDLFGDFYEQNTGMPLNSKQKEKVMEATEASQEMGEEK